MKKLSLKVIRSILRGMQIVQDECDSFDTPDDTLGTLNIIFADNDFAANLRKFYYDIAEGE